jgi:hypothetical protein
VELTWSLLCALAALGVMAGFWRSSLRAREAANFAARETCRQISAQFLDDTVAFQRLRPIRGPDGWLAFERTYQFEYSVDGATRRRGFVIVAGRDVETVGLDALTPGFH